jgi:ATP-dependent helicase HrpB
VPAFVAENLAATDRPGVIVLQPRRMAARLLARRVAEEAECRLGEWVGYQVRHDRRVSRDTRITLVTEGILLRRLQADPNLAGIGAVIFDEFHERHLYGDVSLALLQHRCQERNLPIRLGLMSATLSTEKIEAYLEPCDVLRSEGRTFPIEIEFSKESDLGGPSTPVWDNAAAAFRREARKGFEGSCLVFMPGAYEIRRTVDAISQLPEARGFGVYALHGEQTPDQQDAAIGGRDAANERRVIVSTNVAETSLTLPGIRLVIDSGLARIPGYDARRDLNTLLIEKISQASADQRAGRAGRVAPGRAIRLWSAADHARRSAQIEPEVSRLELSEIVLQMAAAGASLATDFPWFEAPPPDHLHRAVSLLQALGALDGKQQLTEFGRRMATFPLHPRVAKMILAAAEVKAVRTTCLLAALLEGRSILLPVRDKGVESAREKVLFGDAVPPPSDHFAMLRAFQAVAAQRFDPRWAEGHGIHAVSARQAAQVAEQLVKMAESHELPTDDADVSLENLHRILLQGFPDQVAKRLNRHNYLVETAAGRRGELDRYSLARDAELVVTTEIQERTRGREVSVVLSTNAAIEEKWLAELFPDDFSTQQRTEFDATARRVMGFEETRFRELTLRRKEIDTVDETMAAECFAEEILAGRLSLKNWTEATDQWIARVNCLAAACSDLGFVRFAEEDRRFVLEQICYGAKTYRDLKDRDVLPVLRDWLNPMLVPLIDQMAPERLELSNGRRARLRYEADGSVIASAKLQFFYDIPQRELTVANGRIRCKVELLAPNQRPAQVTDDLDAFWSGSYEAVKKELKGRYPKHEWR